MSHNTPSNASSLPPAGQPGGLPLEGQTIRVLNATVTAVHVAAAPGHPFYEVRGARSVDAAVPVVGEPGPGVEDVGAGADSGGDAPSGAGQSGSGQLAVSSVTPPSTGRTGRTGRANYLGAIGASLEIGGEVYNCLGRNWMGDLIVTRLQGPSTSGVRLPVTRLPGHLIAARCAAFHGVQA